MTNKQKLLKGSLRWCARQEWDWLLGLSAPSGATFAQAKGWVDQLVSEIAHADGTEAFRCVTFAKKREPGEPVQLCPHRWVALRRMVALESSVVRASRRR